MFDTVNARIERGEDDAIANDAAKHDQQWDDDNCQHDEVVARSSSEQTWCFWAKRRLAAQFLVNARYFWLCLKDVQNLGWFEDE